MKIKTSELSGVALDWAVAQAAGVDPLYRVIVPGDSWVVVNGGKFSPSTDWSQGGPLIEREQIDIEWDGVDGQAYWWKASHQDIVQFQIGHTPLIAACRAIVAAKLGDEVDVPEGLV